ncbi:uncharacterized protein [Drosophila tropicalis]|uniref:uncharacterized protein n=1 Tax=Drosophila tropicalis TaxID=46794 RepID=UPI0035AB847D
MLCPKGKHVACENNIKSYGKNCTIDAELLEPPQKLRDGIVLRMNELRNQLAGGGFSGFTPADRMATIQWDFELAHLAKFNVLKCVLKRDICSNTLKFGHVGQTVSYRGYRKKIPRLDKIVLKQINTWFKEREKSSMNDIFKYKGPFHGKFKQNFFQIAVGKNDRIGCALLQQTQHGWLQTFLTCNYGYSPVIGKEVYRSGGVAASMCQTGKNPSFPNLCSIDEVYKKDTGNEDETDFKSASKKVKGDQSNVTSSTAEGSPKNVTETVTNTTKKPTELESEKPGNSTGNGETTPDGSLKSRTFKISPRTQTANKTEPSDTVATNNTESFVSLPSNETATQSTVLANSTEISTISPITTPTTTEKAKQTSNTNKSIQHISIIGTIWSWFETANKVKDIFLRFTRLILRLHDLAKKYQIKIITQNQTVEMIVDVLNVFKRTRKENIASRSKDVGDALQNRQLRMKSRGIRGRTMKQKHKKIWRTRSQDHQQDLSDGLVKWRTI